MLPCTKLGHSGEAEPEVGSGRGITHQERVCLHEGDLGIFITRDVYVMFTQRQRKPPFINHYQMPFLSASISSILPKTAKRPSVIDVGNLAFPGSSMTL